MEFKDKNTEKIYKYLKEHSKNSLIHLRTIKSLGQLLKLSPSTVSKKLKVLEEDKLIKVESKGTQGIDIIVNKKVNIEGFLKTNENIIESEEEYAKGLRETVYPTSLYEETNKPKRTSKEQIIHEAIKDPTRKMIEEMNYQVKDLNYPTREVFSLADDPEGYFKAYILSKVYDKLCTIHTDVRQRKFFESMNKAIDDNEDVQYIQSLENKGNYYLKLRDNYKRTQSLKGQFFGTKNFEAFYELYNLSNTLKDFNIIRYMINVFSTISFTFEQGYYDTPIPYPIQFIKDKMIDNYYNYRNKIKESMNKDNRQLSNYTQRMNNEPEYSEDIILQQLKILLMKDYNNLEYDLDTSFSIAIDFDDYKFGIIQQKQRKLLNFYQTFRDTVEDFEDKDKEILDKYVKELIIQEYAPKTITNTYRLAMFPIQRAHMYDTLLTEGHAVVSIGQLRDLGLLHSKTKLLPIDEELSDSEGDIRLGSSYLRAYQDINDYYTIRMFGYFTRVDINIRDIKFILEKYNKTNLIPFNKYGMLSIG